VGEAVGLMSATDHRSADGEKPARTQNNELP